MTTLPRLIWLLIDGFPHWLIERYADDPDTARRLPTLQRLWSRNRISPLMPVWPNCQTPPSLSTLWSGVEPSGTGIVGFEVPDLEADSPITIKRAFSMRPPHVRWIWDHYAEAGHPVRLCHVPFVTAQRLGSRARCVSYGFIPPVVPPSLAPHARSGPFEAWCSESIDDEVTLTFGTWHLEQGTVDICLGAWRPDLQGDDVSAMRSRLRHAAPFVASAPNTLYRDGKLGPRLAEGGDGTAERVFTSCLLQMSSRYLDEFLDGVERADSHLVIGYQPTLDIMLHEFAGYLDPLCRFWSPQGEAIIDELVLTLLGRLDHCIARLATLVSKTDRVLVCSDHGMASLDTIIFPNAALARRGLLVSRSDGNIDVERSICFYHPAETGELWLNIDAARGAGVPAEAIIANLSQDLSGAPGGAPDMLPLRRTAARGFQVLGHLRPGHCQQAKATIADTLWGISKKTGEHGSHSDDSRLQGVVIDLCSTQRRQGIPPIEAKDVAATFMGCRIPQEPAYA
jgi:predicted AlkP superfamily pyrophosphatase or phosphodiesterase